MLNSVPSVINKMTRNIVVNHPNTFACQVYRKVVARADEATVSGLPTMGGLGVISSEDEENIDWDFLGNGYALLAEVFQPSSMMERMDTNNGLNNEQRFLIEPEKPSGDPEFFIPRKNDVMVLVITDDVRLAFQVVDVEAVNNIPPYSMRYVVNRRADLDLI